MLQVDDHCQTTDCEALNPVSALDVDGNVPLVQLIWVESPHIKLNE